MEPKGSLPYSQVPTTCPCAQPDQSRPCHTSHFLKIQFNIILPSKPGSSKWHHSLRFSHQSPVHTSPLLHTCYITWPILSSWFDQPHNIGREVQQTMFLPPCEQPSLTPIHQYKATDKIIVLYILSLHFWIANWKTKDSAPNDSKHSLTTICSYFLPV